MAAVQVIFFTVQNPKLKITKLLQTVALHFSKKEKIHILVPDQTALTFVDELLWNQPREGFYPHSTEALLPYQDLIFISLPLPSMDNYPIVFNLTSSPIVLFPQAKTIYEIEDLSHPQKKENFETKFKAYQKAGFVLCSGK